MRTKTCPLFEREEVLTAVGTLLLLASMHSAAEARTEDSAPSPGRKCGPKPVRFFEWEEVLTAVGTLLLLASMH